MLPEALGSPQLQNSRRMMFLRHLKPLFIVIGIPGTISLQPNCFSFPNGSAVPLDTVLNRLISAAFLLEWTFHGDRTKPVLGLMHQAKAQLMRVTNCPRLPNLL